MLNWQVINIVMAGISVLLILYATSLIFNSAFRVSGSLKQILMLLSSSFIFFLANEVLKLLRFLYDFDQGVGHAANTLFIAGLVLLCICLFRIAWFGRTYGFRIVKFSQIALKKKNKVKRYKLK